MRAVARAWTRCCRPVVLGEALPRRTLCIHPFPVQSRWGSSRGKRGKSRYPAVQTTQEEGDRGTVVGAVASPSMAESGLADAFNICLEQVLQGRADPTLVVVTWLSPDGVHPSAEKLLLSAMHESTVGGVLLGATTDRSYTSVTALESMPYLAVTALFVHHNGAHVVISHRTDGSLPPLPPPAVATLDQLRTNPAKAPLVLALAFPPFEGLIQRVRNMYPHASAVALVCRTGQSGVLVCRGDVFTSGAVVAAVYASECGTEVASALAKMVCGPAVPEVTATTAVWDNLFLPKAVSVLSIPAVVGEEGQRAVDLIDNSPPVVLPPPNTLLHEPHPRVLGVPVTNLEHAVLCGLCNHVLADLRDLDPTPVPRHECAVREIDVDGAPEGKARVLGVGTNLEMMTFKRANVQAFLPRTPYDSWFDGFSFRVALCPGCHTYVGWQYHEGGTWTAPSFVGLMYHSLVLPKVIQGTLAVAGQGPFTLQHDLLASSNPLVTEHLRGKLPLPVMLLRHDRPLFPGSHACLMVREASVMRMMKAVLEEGGPSPLFGLVRWSGDSLQYLDGRLVGMIYHIHRISYFHYKEPYGALVIGAQALARFVADPKPAYWKEFGSYYYKVREVTDKGAVPVDEALQVARTIVGNLQDPWSMARLDDVSHSPLPRRSLEQLSFDLLNRCQMIAADEVHGIADDTIACTNTMERLHYTRTFSEKVGGATAVTAPEDSRDD